MKIKKLQSFFDVLFSKLKTVKGLHGIIMSCPTKLFNKKIKMLAQIELQAVKNKIIRKENALRLYTIPIAVGLVQLRFIHHS